MQVTMAYTSEMSLALPPILKGTAPRIDGTRQHYRKQRSHPKSQPFDAEDLRRRLYVVIAEREARDETRQRERVDAMAAKWAQVERERDSQTMYIERLTSQSATWPAPDVTPPNRRPGAQPKPRTQSSLHNKLRCRTSFLGPSEPTYTGTNTNKSPSTYRHIPDQAAAQFSRTTTSSSMQSEKPLVHTLSQTAVRFYVEGVSIADRRAIHSSITPGKQRTLLQRTRAEQERLHGRNQFQGPRMGGGLDDGIPWRRPSVGETAIAEDDTVSALADLHLHGYRDHHVDRDELDFSATEETLVVKATAANEHRVDWSQSDELLPTEKKGVKLSPLLRKTGSILALRGKLGHLRKNSGDKENNNNNKLRIMTIQEACDEQAEAEADDGSTPMSPNSGSSRSGRLGIWGRLKRR
ncbi:hypothetical protein F4803DRAFT_139624 [Xylaria telfairii]|nr:hypothetical protein F4803DRAFT_139624 [Xylaria telfairii]